MGLSLGWWVIFLEEGKRNKLKITKMIIIIIIIKKN